MKKMEAVMVRILYKQATLRATTKYLHTSANSGLSAKQY